MTLFGFGKKKEKEINAPVCTCNGNCSVSETVEPENLNNCCQDIQGRICCIKVLGSGCASCHALYENTQSAVKAMGISVEVEYITDLKKVMEYGVMSVPALVVNNKVFLYREKPSEKHRDGKQVSSLRATTRIEGR